MTSYAWLALAALAWLAGDALCRAAVAMEVADDVAVMWPVELADVIDLCKE